MNVIKINLRKKEDYTSKFNDDSLSKELSNYIMEEYKGFDIRSEFYIEINSLYEMDDNEKEKIVSMIRANFGTEISDMISNRRREIKFDIFTVMLAIIAVIFYLFSSDIPILSEFMLVFSWVLIWESAYNLIFGSMNNKVNLERRKRLTNCKIVFK